jgi:hypothetical protein
MNSAGQQHKETGRTEQNKARATARMIYYAAHDADELGLGECGQLLHFVADLIRLKYDLQDQPALVRWQQMRGPRQ